MALPRWQSTFTDEAGNVRASLSVEVRDESSGALAALYSDRAGTSPKSNPTPTDANGYLSFYVAPGRYRIQATDIDWRDVDIKRAADLDGAAAANFGATPQVGGEDVLVENTSGVVIQQAFTTTGASASTTSIIPYDDTIPQITEGAEALTISFTPKRGDSRIRAKATLVLRSDTLNVVRTIALFVGGASDAISASGDLSDTGTATGGSSVSATADIASTGAGAAVAFSVRYGPSEASTMYLNSSGSGDRRFGGVASSIMEITEYMP